MALKRISQEEIERLLGEVKPTETPEPCSPSPTPENYCVECGNYPEHTIFCSSWVHPGIKSRKDWDARFYALAQHIAGWSKDPSTRVGSLIVGPDREIRSVGYNGFPRGVKDVYTTREAKLLMTIHAESNALANAARINAPVQSCTLYTTYYPCAQCAALIIQSGLKRVVTPPIDLTIPAWQENWRVAQALFQEVHMEITLV